MASTPLGLTAGDLTHWLGPLSPAFAAIAAGPTPNASPAPDSRTGPEPSDGPTAEPIDPTPDELRSLFHTLNNQLGVILTYAELLEAKAPDAGLRGRATQIVSATLDALATAKQIRYKTIT
jgi:hypothetical protein